TTRLAGNMGRDRETVADTMCAPERKNMMISWCQRDHRRHPRPGKADAGDMAGAVHRVTHTKGVLVIIARPALRIIMQSDRRITGRGYIDMMAEREILEAQFHADGGHSDRQVLGTADRLDDTRKLHRHARIRHLALL